MQNWFNIKLTFNSYLLALSIYTIFRAILFITEIDRLNDFTENENWVTILKAFFMGIRFDIVISSYILSIPCLILSVLNIISKPSNLTIKIVFYYTLIMFSLTFIICGIDIPYFNHFFSRFSVSAFQWVESPSFVIKMIIQEPRYWLIMIPLIFLLVVFYKRLKRIFNKNYQPGEKKINIGLKILVSILFLGIMFIGIRGRIAKKSPIRIGTAYFSNNAFLNQLGLNPTFKFFKSYLTSLDKKNMKLQLMEDSQAIMNMQKYLQIEQPDKRYPLARKVEPDTINIKKYNVVLVIMESMSTAKMGRYGNPDNLTPFLDSIAKQSYCFDNFYTDGIHTYNGLFSTLFSYPTIFLKHPMKGIDMLKYNGISNVLKKHDYSTIYFTTHDGQFDNVEGFFKANDFDQVITQADYPLDKIESALGVPDDYLFEFSIPILDKLYNQEKPFFATFMTASDHRPFILPDYFTPKQNELKKQIVEYTDWSLKKLLTMASKQKWFDNTIFVFVADHGWSMNAIYDMPLNYHHSPLIIYAPELLEENKTFNCIGGQIDIFPTIMGILQLPYTNNTFGIDLINESRNYIFLNGDDKYGVLNNDFFLIVRNDKSESLYKYRNKEKVNFISEYGDIVNDMKKYWESNIQAAQYIVNNKMHYVVE